MVRLQFPTQKDRANRAKDYCLSYHQTCGSSSNLIHWMTSFYVKSAVPLTKNGHGGVIFDMPVFNVILFNTSDLHLGFKHIPHRHVKKICCHDHGSQWKSRRGMIAVQFWTLFAIVTTSNLTSAFFLFHEIVMRHPDYLITLSRMFSCESKP